MATVLELIHTPEWWFTVFVAGLVVSLVAAFLKDWLSAGFARAFHAYRGYYTRSKEREKLKIARLVENPSFLAIRYARLTFVTIVFVLNVFLAVVTPAYGFLVHRFPEIEIWQPMPPDISYVLSRWLSLAFALAAMVLEFHIMSSFLLCERAWKQLRKRA
jgi:hypothetical protein